MDIFQEFFGSLLSYCYCSFYLWHSSCSSFRISLREYSSKLLPWFLLVFLQHFLEESKIVLGSSEDDSERILNKPQEKSHQELPEYHTRNSQRSLGTNLWRNREEFLGKVPDGIPVESQKNLLEGCHHAVIKPWIKSSYLSNRAWLQIIFMEFLQGFISESL